MGLRDALRSLRSGGDDDKPSSEANINSLSAEAEDSDWFRPKQAGTYIGGPEHARYLRFHVTGRVYVAGGTADAPSARPLLGPENADPTVGQYTGAGRFVVQRKFERPMVFTVLNADDAGLTVRLTATGVAQTGEHRYEFEPDPA